MSGPFGDFDRYCIDHNIQPDELGAAFAAFLHESSGGEWDGEMERVSDGGRNVKTSCDQKWCWRRAAFICFPFDQKPVVRRCERHRSRPYDGETCEEVEKE